MKVKELISKLQEYDQEMPIYVSSGHLEDYRPSDMVFNIYKDEIKGNPDYIVIRAKTVKEWAHRVAN